MRAVAAVRREDRGEHSHAEDAAELADRIVRTGCLTLLLRLDRREDDVRDRRPEHRHADARDCEGRDQLPVRRRRRRDRSDGRESRSLQDQAHAHEPVPADPVGQRSGDRRDEEGQRLIGCRREALTVRINESFASPASECGVLFDADLEAIHDHAPLARSPGRRARWRPRCPVRLRPALLVHRAGHVRGGAGGLPAADTSTKT